MKKIDIKQKYGKRRWWPFIEQLLTEDRHRDQICHDLADRGFAQLIYNNWEFVIRRFCVAIDRDRRKPHPQWHLGCMADAECCMEQMLMPYSFRGACLKRDLVRFQLTINN